MAQVAPARGRNWALTWNNYTAEQLQSLKDKIDGSEWICYAIVAKETSQSGTPHLQGYVQILKNAKQGWVIKELGCEGAHIEPARTSADINIRYCSKEDQDPWIYGQTKATHSEAGKVNWQRVHADIARGLDFNELSDIYPSVCIRYMHSIGEMIKERKRKIELEESRVAMQGITLKPWQIVVYNRFVNQGNRKILWVVDEEGGKGKTMLAKYIGLKNDGLYIENAKKADIAQAWNLETMIACNLTREKSGKIGYSYLESFKDGCMFSAKYKSKTKITMKNIRVVVFANWFPQFNMMSADRWDICELTKDDVGDTVVMFWRQSRITSKMQEQIDEQARRDHPTMYN